MGDRDVKLFVMLLVIAALALAGWYFRDLLVPPPLEPAGTEALAPAEPAADTGPKYPIEPAWAEDRDGRKLVPLPPLDDSDAYFLLALVDAFGPEIERLLASDALIDRFVATIDNLPRGHVAEKIRPAGRLADAFVAEENGDGPAYLSAENYRRYEPLVTRLAAADVRTVADAYRRFYPLFQQSFERLGYPNAYFNDRVVEVIDHLLAAPQPQEPIRLLRPHVLYEFADPELESLSAGQKLLIRMGPGNAAIVKRFLKALRVEIVNG